MSSELASFWDKWWVAVVVIIIAALGIGTFYFVSAAISDSQAKLITKSNVTLVSQTSGVRDSNELVLDFYWVDSNGVGYTMATFPNIDRQMPPLETPLTIKYGCSSNGYRVLYSFVSEVPTPTPTVNPYKCVTNVTTGACE